MVYDIMVSQANLSVGVLDVIVCENHKKNSNWHTKVPNQTPHLV